MHSEDAKFLKNPDLNGSRFFGTPFSIKKEPNIYDKSGILEFEDHKIKILHTPGHTPGSVSLLINNRLFSGDVLFSNSIGRTDFPLASHEQLISAIKEKILTLPDDTIVHPGHGLSTTVGREKEGNPFL